MNLKNAIAKILPNNLRALIRSRWKKVSTNEADRRSGVAIGSFDGFDVVYREKTADEDVLKHSFSCDIFLTGTPEYKPREEDVIIDVGAHIGTFSLLASRKVNCGKVYAIEASNDSFNLLRINVAMNRCGNISAHRLALADKDGSCTLYHDIGNWGHSTVKRLSESNEIVKSQTLASFLEENKIEYCQFMKLNCEGGEFPILLGATSEVLKRFGCILVLYHCDLWNKNTAQDLISHMHNSGFKCVTRNCSENRGWIIATKL